MHEILTTAERAFLKRHKLSPTDVYDGRGEHHLTREEEAKRLGKRVLLGETCDAGDHRLRNRKGHCIQCDIRKLVFQDRYNQIGYVYVAYSAAKKLSKIGFAADPAARETTVAGYANASDWCMLFHAFVERAAEVEWRAQSSLSKFHRAVSYTKSGGVEQTSKEAFACKPHIAINAVIDALQALDRPVDKLWIDQRRVTEFDKS